MMEELRRFQLEKAELDLYNQIHPHSYNGYLTPFEKLAELYN